MASNTIIAKSASKPIPRNNPTNNWLEMSMIDPSPLYGPEFSELFQRAQIARPPKYIVNDSQQSYKHSGQVYRKRRYETTREIPRRNTIKNAVKHPSNKAKPWAHGRLLSSPPAVIQRLTARIVKVTDTANNPITARSPTRAIPRDKPPKIPTAISIRSKLLWGTGPPIGWFRAHRVRTPKYRVPSVPGRPNRNAAILKNRMNSKRIGSSIIGDSWFTFRKKTLGPLISYSTSCKRNTLFSHQKSSIGEEFSPVFEIHLFF